MLRSPPAAALVFLPLILLLCLSPAALFPQSAGKADALYDRAANLYGQQRYQEAAKLLERSAALDRSQGKERRLDLAYDYRLLGLCYLQGGRLGEAEPALREAKTLFAALGRREEELHTRNDLALLDYYRGRYAEAAAAYDEALEAARRLGFADQAVQILNNLGLVYYAWGRYREALDVYREAREQNLAAGREGLAVRNLANMAAVYLAWGRYPEAAERYRQALGYFRSRDDTLNTTNTIQNLGLVYSAWGRYDRALELFDQALELATAGGFQAARASALSGSGSALYATGRFDQALEAYTKALQLFESFGMTLNVISVQGSIGMVYQAWGRYQEARRYYEQALQAAQRIGAQDQVMVNLRSLASIHQGAREYGPAEEAYKSALELARHLGRRADVAVTLDALGTLYFQWRRFDQALEAYRRAQGEAKKLDKRDEMARALIHLGGVYQVQGQTAEAMGSYRKALELTRAAGSRADEATALNNIGTLYLNEGRYREAADSFRRAIAVKEQLRDTASGEVRRDFLASWISSYRWLIVTYLQSGDAEQAFDAMELIKARYLSEQIAQHGGPGGADTGTGKQPNRPAASTGFSGADSFRRSLGEEQALLSYANIDWEHPLAAFADRHGMKLFAIEYGPFVARAAGEHRRTILQAANRTRGFTMVEAEEPAGAAKVREDSAERFAEIIRAYRWLLSHPGESPVGKTQRENLARELYALLVQPVQRRLEGKRELIVVPDGILGFLPFGTLIGPDGKYLVEKLRIRYLPSLTVAEQLRRRRGGDRPPKPLLALGARSTGELHRRRGQGRRPPSPASSSSAWPPRRGAP